MYFDSLCAAFARLPQVEALALGGSRAGEQYDEKSDYDLYVYCTEVPQETVRRQILAESCSYMELGNRFWELEDDCVLRNGIPIDILYRSLSDFTRDVASVVEGHWAHNGYTTCMWHNLLHSKVLFDRNGAYRAAQERFDLPYPEQLRANIIRNNLRLLTKNLPSYDVQIKKAVARGDLVSVNHRTAAFLESYFDILFALNRMTHPGEKRMMTFLKAQADILPQDFEETLNALFTSLFGAPQSVPDILDTLIYNLINILPEAYRDIERGETLCSCGSLNPME